MHVATYRLDDLRSTAANLGPDVFEAEISPTIADTLSTRLSTVCEQQGWKIIDIAVAPDRIEALITGMEPEGETGEAVAMALDGAAYGGAQWAATN